MDRNVFIQKRREIANTMIQNENSHSLIMAVHPEFADVPSHNINDYTIGSKEFLKKVMAYDLIKPGTLEMYEVCECQYSVFNLYKYPKGGKTLVEILNYIGQKLYEFVLEKVAKNEFTDELTDYVMTYENSGMWHANEMSEYFDPSNEMKGCLNSFNNRHITGFSKKNNNMMTTSACIFIMNGGENGGVNDEENDEENDGVNDRDIKWCFTKSGSLYKLTSTLN